jgi:hypothetical protein
MGCNRRAVLAQDQAGRVHCSKQGHAVANAKVTITIAQLFTNFRCIDAHHVIANRVAAPPTPATKDAVIFGFDYARLI